MDSVRFWSKVYKTDSCWIWTGALNGGYGYLWHNGRAVKAHRFAFILAHGPIPDGQCILHRCDNPPCVNPDHLSLGTRIENNSDKMAKGRYRTGETIAEIEDRAKSLRTQMPPRVAHALDSTTSARRFWEKVDKSGDCWLYTGARDPKGYGVLSRNNRRWFAHRFAYVVSIGTIPEGLQVCHRCDTPSCVRPDHLFLGTDRDNRHDMATKGRGTSGERNIHAILKATDVDAIRQSYAQGQSRSDLAERYCVSRGTISDVVARRSWSHVP